MNAPAIAHAEIEPTRGYSRTLEVLDREHRTALFQEALRLTHGDASEAEDLVQETLLKALRYERGGGKIRDRSRRWLLRILTNSYIDRHRRRVVRPVELPFEDVAEFVTSVSNAEPVARPLDEAAVLPWTEQRERFRWVFDDEVLCALSQLPEVFRAAVVLADVEGLSYQEAADRLQVPLGTIMSRLHRGRARMRRALTDPLSPCLN